MLKIAITGGIASGKTECINFISNSLNYKVFSSDLIVHELLMNNEEIFSNIKNKFPDVIINGKIDKKLLGKKIFTNTQNKDFIESLIHPILRTKRQDFFTNSRSNNEKIVFCEIPLLFEKKYTKEFDKSILIMSDINIRLKRFLERSKNATQEDFYNIINNQITDDDKIKMADFAIANNETLDLLYVKLQNIINTLLNENHH